MVWRVARDVLNGTCTYVYTLAANGPLASDDLKSFADDELSIAHSFGL